MSIIGEMSKQNIHSQRKRDVFPPDNTKIVLISQPHGSSNHSKSFELVVSEKSGTKEQPIDERYVLSITGGFDQFLTNMLVQMAALGVDIDRSVEQAKWLMGLTDVIEREMMPANYTNTRERA